MVVPYNLVRYFIDIFISSHWTGHPGSVYQNTFVSPFTLSMSRWAYERHWSVTHGSLRKITLPNSGEHLLGDRHASTAPLTSWQVLHANVTNAKPCFSCLRVGTAHIHQFIPTDTQLLGVSLIYCRTVPSK